MKAQAELCITDNTKSLSQFNHKMEYKIEFKSSWRPRDNRNYWSVMCLRTCAGDFRSSSLTQDYFSEDSYSYQKRRAHTGLCPRHEIRFGHYIPETAHKWSTQVKTNKKKVSQINVSACNTEWGVNVNMLERGTVFRKMAACVLQRYRGKLCTLHTPIAHTEVKCFWEPSKMSSWKSMMIFRNVGNFQRVG